jgi:hypothetical protein
MNICPGSLRPAVAIVALGLLSLPAVPAAQDVRATGRPVILMVHGRGQLGRDTAAMRVELQRSLESGLQLPTTGTPFENDDIRLVWYADVLDPASDTGCQWIDSNRRSRARWESRRGLQSFWELLRGLVQSATAELGSGNGQDARGLLGELLYASDLFKRCGAERRLHDELARASREQRPVILVSHSFGAIVTYGLLDGYSPPGNEAPDVRRWITVGSVLGVPAVRFLMLGDSGTEIPKPALVRQWVNVVADSDALSAKISSDSAGAPAIEIAAEHQGRFAHELPSYLRDSSVARSITASWCQSFSGGSRAPDWCSSVGDPVRR